MLYRIFVVVFAISMSACSSWVYRIDIPQGNYMEQKDIDKLQIGMTKEQVKYVLGSPVLVDSFDDNIWYYVYQFKSGRDSQYNSRKEFVVKFEQQKLASATGDFELPQSFYTPIEN